MKHFELAKWVDSARGLVEGSVRVAMERHLATGCPQRRAGPDSSLRVALRPGGLHLATAREGADLARHSSAVALRQFRRTPACRPPHPAVPGPTSPLPSRGLLTGPPTGE